MLNRWRERKGGRKWGSLGLRWLVALLEHPDRLLTFAAVPIGAVTALGAIGFSWLIHIATYFFFERVGRGLEAYDLYYWLLPLLPMCGGVFVGLITFYIAPEAEGHGVPEVMDAMARSGGRIRFRVTAAKAVASALTIGSGGAAGTEGPIIQIGAAFGSGFGQWLRLGLDELRVLIGCGAAAGIAAIFNAPIAGVLFAVEVLVRDVSLRSFVSIIIASVTSSTVTQAIRGHNDPLFPVPVELRGLQVEQVYQFSVSEVGNYLVLGLLCGLVALSFIKLLYWLEDVFRKLPVHGVLRPVAGALVLGLIAVASELLVGQRVPAGYDRLLPAVMGNSYPVIRETLEPGAYGLPGGWVVTVLLVLMVGKLLATTLTLGSGGSGGVFAPSLFLGAVTGGAFGLLIQHIPAFAHASPGAYALVGMAAVVGSSIHAPLTATLIVFEMTRDYKVIVPIMLASVAALAVAQLLEPASIYTMKLLRRGVDIYRGRDISLLRHVAVRDAMRSGFVTVPPGAGLMQVISKFIENPGTTMFVVNDQQRLLGVITGDQTRSVMVDVPSFEAFLIARDMMLESGFPTVKPADTLADVMKRLSRYRGEIPVVEDGRLVGAIWPEDVIERYNSELFKRDMASSMVATVSRVARAQSIPAVENTSLAEIRVPLRFIGKTLSSLDIRNRYGVTVLLIKQQGRAGEELIRAVPDGDYAFGAGDVMLVIGKDDDLRRLERGYV